jgi:hypothetical protein
VRATAALGCHCALLLRTTWPQQPCRECRHSAWAAGCCIAAAALVPTCRLLLLLPLLLL